MQVKFITSGANSAFGGFSEGDTLRCSPEMAKHLVEEIKCAVYDDPKAKKHPEKEPEHEPKAEPKKPEPKEHQSKEHEPKAHAHRKHKAE